MEETKFEQRLDERAIIALLFCRFLSLSFDLHATPRAFWHLLSCTFSASQLHEKTGTGFISTHPNFSFA